MEEAAEGRKGFLCMAIRKGLCKRKVFVREKAAFADSKNCSNEQCFGCENERLLRAKRKAFCKWKSFGMRKRQIFSSCKATR